MASRKKKPRKKAKVLKKKAPSASVRPNKTTFNAEDYVRTVAQTSRTAGCRVCCHPDVKAALEAVCAQMDTQNVRISGAQLLRDMKKHFRGFHSSDEKFRKHIRECMEREL